MKKTILLVTLLTLLLCQSVMAQVAVGGRVKWDNGEEVVGVEGVRVHIQSAGFGTNDTDFTDANGYYYFPYVLSGFTYVVSVHKKDWTFDDDGIWFGIVENEITNLDFVGHPPE